MDPIVTGLIVKASEVGASVADSTAKETGGLLVRLFGPSADVMGQHWAEQLREKNLQRLLRKTEKHARTKENSGGDPGYANPRVASQVFEYAQYADSEVVAEYLSGVLASSRSATGTNDAGVAWSSVVSRLSSDQLKLHYLLYASARSQVISQGFGRPNEAHRLEIAIPLNEALVSMGVRAIEQFADAVDGLMREGLIGDGYRYGGKGFIFEKELKRADAQVDFPHANGVRLGLTIHGMRLFVWGTGAGPRGLSSYIDPSVALSTAEASIEAPLSILPAYIVKNIVTRNTELHPPQEPLP